MNLKVKEAILITCTTFLSSVAIAAPEVSFSGYLDADGWADFTGKYYTNTELDLGLTVKFSDAVSAHVYTTANGVYSTTTDENGAIIASGTGQVPAGYGNPKERWLTINFDGFDITYKSSMGTFSVGDIVYQYGKFNYYIYKRFSMITRESFSRGIKYSVGNTNFTQDIQIGISDKDSYTADINAASGFTLSENHSVGLYYGIRGSSQVTFKEGTDFFAGLEYKGNFGDVLSLKFDVGYNSLAGEKRGNLTTILVEPSLSLGKFTTAATAFFSIDDSSDVNLSAERFGIAEEMLLYIEPGYTFTEHFGVGLPLEYHDPDFNTEKDGAFWVVPTFYIYPFENVQWWLWGQVVKYTAKDTDNAYGFGSEIIVTF